MVIDTSNPLNEKTLQYLSCGTKITKIMLAAPDSVIDPYTLQGSHPDIVERVWDKIGASLPEDCRCLLYGTPALVHPKCGVVLAICNGTQYNMRLLPDDFKEAIASGVRTQTQWTYGGEMDSVVELGPNWVFGCWREDEIKWCRNIYEKVSKS